MPPLRAQNSGGASADGRGHLGAQGAHQAASLLRRGQEGRIGGGGRHVVHRTGVDPADEGIHQAVGHPLAELARHQRADGAVADGAAHVGTGQQRVPRQSELAPQSEDARSGGGPEPGRDAQGQAVGKRAHAPARPHAGAAPGDRDQCISQPDLVTEVERLGAPSEEAVGTRIDDATAELRAVERAAEPGRRLQHVTSRTDVGHPPPLSSHAAASPLMPPPTTTTRPTVGSVPTRHVGGRRRRRPP